MENIQAAGFSFLASWHWIAAVHWPCLIHLLLISVIRLLQKLGLCLLGQQKVITHLWVVVLAFSFLQMLKDKRNDIQSGILKGLTFDNWNWYWVWVKNLSNPSFLLGCIFYTASSKYFFWQLIAKHQHWRFREQPSEHSSLLGAGWYIRKGGFASLSVKSK